MKRNFPNHNHHTYAVLQNRVHNPNHFDYTKITKPEMTRADLYFSWTEDTRSQKNIVLAAMLANEKESTLYTKSNWLAVISNIMAE